MELGILGFLSLRGSLSLPEGLQKDVDFNRRVPRSDESEWPKGRFHGRRILIYRKIVLEIVFLLIKETFAQSWASKPTSGQV